MFNYKSFFRTCSMVVLAGALTVSCYAADVNNAPVSLDNVTRVAYACRPSVVKIYAIPFGGMQMLSVDDFIDYVSDSTNRVMANAMTGSGVIYNAQQGYIITNCHVVAGEKEVTVQLFNGKKLPGKVLGVDELADLAVVQVESGNLMPVTMGDSSKLRVGEAAIAIGSPKGLRDSVASGIISTVERDVDEVYYHVIQIDTPISHGSSGGGLFNAAGQLIGITSGAKKDGNNLGWAIPINIVKPVIEQIEKTGKFSRVTFGFSVCDEQMAFDWGINWTYPEGVIIYKVAPGSIAETNDLMIGDIIQEVNGTPIKTVNTLKQIILNCHQGDSINIKLNRYGSVVSKRIQL